MPFCVESEIVRPALACDAAGRQNVAEKVASGKNHQS